MKLHDYVKAAIDAELTRQIGSRELLNLTVDGTLNLDELAEAALNARKRWHRATDPAIRILDDGGDDD